MIFESLRFSGVLASRPRVWVTVTVWPQASLAIQSPSLFEIETRKLRVNLRHLARGWRNVEKRPTLTFFFRRSGWPPPLPLPTKYSMFSEFQCFFECFFVIWIYFFLIHVPILSVYLTINLQDPHQARKCSVHKSLLGGTCVGNYSKRRVLCTLLLPPISLPGLVRIGSGHILEQSQWLSIGSLLDVADVDGGFRTATGTSKCTPPPKGVPECETNT
jgi:hypothetical protein